MVHLHDVDVSKTGGGLGLTLESLAFVGSGKVTGQQHLDGDRAVEALIPRPIHNTHAAPAQLVLHVVTAEMRRLGRPQPGHRRAGLRAGGRGKQDFELGLEPAQVSQARPNLGHQFGVALAHLVRALTRVEDDLEQMSKIVFASHRCSLRPREAGGYRRRYTRHAYHQS